MSRQYPRATELLPLSLLALLLSAEPAAARVDTREGVCFQRQRSSAAVVRQLGACTIYVGTVGFDRALWGFHLATGQKIDAWQQAHTSQVVVNGKPGFLYLPPGVRGPDRLEQGQTFCLGEQGKAVMTCGQPGG